MRLNYTDLVKLAADTPPPGQGANPGAVEQTPAEPSWADRMKSGAENFWNTTKDYAKKGWEGTTKFFNENEYGQKMKEFGKNYGLDAGAILLASTIVAANADKKKRGRTFWTSAGTLTALDLLLRAATAYRRGSAGGTGNSGATTPAPAELKA